MLAQLTGHVKCSTPFAAQIIFPDNDGRKDMCNQTRSNLVQLTVLASDLYQRDAWSVSALLKVQQFHPNQHESMEPKVKLIIFCLKFQPNWLA